jgi:hypothetical protein
MLNNTLEVSPNYLLPKEFRTDQPQELSTIPDITEQEDQLYHQFRIQSISPSSCAYSQHKGLSTSRLDT